MAQFCWILDIFKDYSILAEKQQLKPRKSNSLINFASIDTQFDPQVTRLVEWNESWVKKPCVIFTKKSFIRMNKIKSVSNKSW